MLTSIAQYQSPTPSSLPLPHNLPHQPDRLFDHLCSDIQMGARANPAIHHGEKHTALAERSDHLLAADAGAIGVEEHEIGFGLLYFRARDLRQPPRQRAGVGVIVGEAVDMVVERINA